MNKLQSPWRRTHTFAIILIIALGVACYLNGLGNEMFWDDDDFILKNRFIKDWAYFPEFFKQNLVAGGYLVSNYWRPLLLTVFAVEWHLWQDGVMGWHVVSMAFHIGVAVVLYFLLNRLFANRTLGLVVALIWIAHPAHNEAVVYVNSLGDSLASLFVLSSLFLYTRFRKSTTSAVCSRNYFFALLCYPLALMSKETGFVLVALIVLTDGLLLQTSPSFWVRVKKVAAAAWPFVLMALIYLALRATTLNFANSFNFYNEETNAFTSSFAIRLMTFFKVITQYVAFIFLPYEQKVERLLPWAQGLWEWDVAVGGIIFTAMVWAGFKFWKSKPWLSWGIGWFFAAIAPTSNVLVPINAVIYEHFLYMPMIGILLISMYAILQWDQHHKAYPTLGKILVLVLILFCAINVRRNFEWKTAIGFYEQLVKYAPSYRVINNLGMEYADKGIHDKALIWYKKAMDMDPKNPVAYHNYAGTLRDTGHVEEAIVNFNKALQLNPNFVFSYRSLAELFYRQRKLDLTQECLLRALSITPDDANLREALASVQAELKIPRN